MWDLKTDADFISKLTTLTVSEHKTGNNNLKSNLMHTDLRKFTQVFFLN